MTRRRTVTPADVASAVQLACLLEASAPKPGNVSPGRDFEDLAYTDFLASAAAIGESFLRAPEWSVGRIVLGAIRATSRWCRTNSNLGMVLLLAPLAKAVPHSDGDLRSAVEGILEATSVDDARDVYEAIRLAAPGGLGNAEEQDVRDEPTVTLLDAMRLAAERDDVAREYSTGYATTFGIGVPALERALGDGLEWTDAVVELFLQLLAERPDTHIARRGGRERAEQVSDRARHVLDTGGVRTREGRRAVEALDGDLRDARHVSNPGTAADLTAASVFVVLIGGGQAEYRLGDGRRDR